MNGIFFTIIAIAFITAAYRQMIFDPSAVAAGEKVVSPMEKLGLAMIDNAEASVTLALGLVGVMALFLGLMRIAVQGGLLQIIARLLRPVLTRLFPDIPADHPAMGAIIMNIAANALGLGNAATPFGIKAMQALDQLNPHKGSASNAMVLFLAINTSSVTLLPTGVIALRAAAGSADPAGIVPTTLFATFCSTAIAIISAKLLQRFFAPGPMLPTAADTSLTAPEEDTPLPPVAGEGDKRYPAIVSFAALALLLSIVPLTIFYGKAIAPWIIPSLALLFLSFGLLRKVPIYEAFVAGASDGFQVALRIIPYLVAILVAVGMFRASGAMDLLLQPLAMVTGPLGLPAEALPMALLRPLSGSGAYGILASLINDTAIGPDSYIGYLVSTIQGSTETTFYVLAVYFGAVRIKYFRHAIWAALSADIAGIAAAVAICSWLYGG